MTHSCLSPSISHGTEQTDLQHASTCRHIAKSAYSRSTTPLKFSHKLFPSPPLDNIHVMMIVCRLRGNIIRQTLCWIARHNVHRPQHTYMSSSYRSNRLGLSHWGLYAVCRGGCLELYYCITWWSGSGGIQAWSLTTNWFPSVLWHRWFGHLVCKNRPRNDL